MLTRSDLHEYQNRAIEFIKEKKRVALFLEMGLGKTASSLTTILDIHDSLDTTKTLVVAPLRVANATWHTEAKRWQHTKDMTFAICTGSEKNRIAQLHKTADVYVINRENIPWLVSHYKNKWPFDSVIIDESSSFKSSSTGRFKALRKVLHLIDYMVLLTGTPSPNGLLDLWSQIYLLDNGERLGRSMTAYKQRFFESDYMGYKWKLKEGAKEKIYKLISDITLSMKAEDYIELPDRLDQTVSVELPAKYKKEYETLEKDFFLELEEGSEIEAESAATLANKLMQFCNGSMYTDDAGNWVEIHKAKLDALNDIIEDNLGENILVAYNYKADMERLTARFKQAIVMDKKGEAADRWNNGEIPLLLAHPASAGWGLNLQRGGSLIVWFGLNWSLEYYQQFNARLHRQGQERPVRIIHLVTNGCIDEKVITVIGEKAETQEDLINALKAR